LSCGEDIKKALSPGRGTKTGKQRIIAMYIKIHFNDKPLFLCDNVADKILEPYLHHDDAVYIDEFSTQAIKSMLHEMAQPEVHAGIYYYTNLEELKKAFWKKFFVIKAAGGLVLNVENDLLMIFRRGHWDLPKGKLDPGETLAECALREVSEETGLTNIQLQHELITTYHTYHENGKLILKESYWYQMKVTSNQQLIPQATEDIQQAIWADENKTNDCLKNAFPSIVDVVTYYRHQ
jgi:ADP-ribose pyrophosphatase YjhB (NUDIX family)